MNDLECPNCGYHDLDNGSFDYNGERGVKTHTPQPLHYVCMECSWSGSKPNNVGDRQSMLEDKADGEMEDSKLAEYARIHGTC